MVTIKDLEAFGDGWNRHDVDFIMTFMADDCVFETTAGREACGTRYEGRERVREAFAKVFKIFPDATSALPAISWPATAGCPSGCSPAPRRTERRSRSTAATCSPSETTRSSARIPTSRTGWRDSI